VRASSVRRFGDWSRNEVARLHRGDVSSRGQMQATSSSRRIALLAVWLLALASAYAPIARDVSGGGAFALLALCLFPGGLVVPALTASRKIAPWINVSDAIVVVLIAFIWILYILVTRVIFSAKEKRLLAWWIALGLALSLNVAGCHVAMESFRGLGH
jgi:hypothetical protein